MIANTNYRSKDVALIAQRSRLARGAADLEAFLPLSDAQYLVLLALGAPEISERGLEVTLEQSLKARALPPGALATALARLVELGLLAKSETTGEEPHRLTELGDAVLFAESGRRRRQFDFPTMPHLKVLLQPKRRVG